MTGHGEPVLNFVRIRESKLIYELPTHTKHYCLRARQSKRKHHCLASLCSIGRFFGCFVLKTAAILSFGATGATVVNFA